MIIQDYFRFTNVYCITRAFTYVRPTTFPILKVIMARVYLTRNTMVNTGERETPRKRRRRREAREGTRRGRRKAYVKKKGKRKGASYVVRR